ncbi:hypothetical protein HYH03_015762 [Edaphochlamys debaryana]|uniref:Bulb-type lectin domain-containing protein n=1 Tax=Edaphochlamys debaryana TaxID=47281 RepID=A0A836BS93_9CHLO|nr:hypothetical protein HYH03_015762 [Edaphochlamys debaryana]|eukprot:KAG2485488.1 hypothetical protein HYH03_015762 [Edaphochlamys debaryana]
MYSLSKRYAMARPQYAGVENGPFRVEVSDAGYWAACQSLTATPMRSWCPAPAMLVHANCDVDAASIVNPTAAGYTTTYADDGVCMDLSTGAIGAALSSRSCSYDATSTDWPAATYSDCPAAIPAMVPSLTTSNPNCTADAPLTACAGPAGQACSIASDLPCNTVRSPNGGLQLRLVDPGWLGVFELGGIKSWISPVTSNGSARNFVLSANGAWVVTNPRLLANPLVRTSAAAGPFRLAVDEADGSVSVRSAAGEEVYTTAPVCPKPATFCADGTLSLVECGDGGARDWVCTTRAGMRYVITSGRGCEANDLNTGFPYAPNWFCPMVFATDINSVLMSTRVTRPCPLKIPTCASPSAEAAVPCGLYANPGSGPWPCARLDSPSRQYYLVIRPNGGNLEVADSQDDTVVWSSNTASSGAKTLQVLRNGTWALVRLDGSPVLRSVDPTTGTSYPTYAGDALGPFRLHLGDDGSLALLNRNNKEAWTSRRACVPSDGGGSWCAGSGDTLFTLDCDGDGLTDAACRTASGGQLTLLSTRQCRTSSTSAPSYQCPAVFLSGDPDPMDFDLIVSWRTPANLRRSIIFGRPPVLTGVHEGDNAAATPLAASFESVMFTSKDGQALPEGADYWACLRRRSGEPVTPSPSTLFVRYTSFGLELNGILRDRGFMRLDVLPSNTSYCQPTDPGFVFTTTYVRPPPPPPPPSPR